MRAASATVAATDGCTRSVTSFDTLPMRWIDHAAALGRHGLAGEALAGEFDAHAGVDADRIEGVGIGGAAARVGC